jgi:hypothetical protein
VYPTSPRVVRWPARDVTSPSVKWVPPQTWLEPPGSSSFLIWMATSFWRGPVDRQTEWTSACCPEPCVFLTSPSVSILAKGVMWLESRHETASHVREGCATCPYCDAREANRGRATLPPASSNVIRLKRSGGGPQPRPMPRGVTRADVRDAPQAPCARVCAMAAPSSSRPRSISASVTVSGGAIRMTPAEAPARTILALSPSCSAMSVTASDSA